MQPTPSDARLQMRPCGQGDGCTHGVTHARRAASWRLPSSFLAFLRENLLTFDFSCTDVLSTEGCVSWRRLLWRPGRLRGSTVAWASEELQRAGWPVTVAMEICRNRLLVPDSYISNQGDSGRVHRHTG